MIITKESETVKILKEMFSMARTARTSTNVSAVEFVEKKGILVRFDDSPREIFIKNTDVDVGFSVSGSMFVTALVAGADSNGQVEITKENTEVKVGNFLFKDTESSYFNEREPNANPHIKFTKEQFAKLENDFTVTIANYFSNPKNTDAIGFAINEGTLWEIAPGASLYKIAKIDAVVDEVQLAQDFGHEDRIFLFPRKVFDLAKHSQNIEIYFNKDYEQIEINTDTVYLIYNPQRFGVNKFKSNLAVRQDGTLALSEFKAVIPMLEEITSHTFENVEDMNVTLKFHSNEIDSEIEDCHFKTTKETSVDEDVTINTNIVALLYVLKSMPKTAKIKEIEGDMIIVSNGDSYFYLPNGNFSN